MSLLPKPMFKYLWQAFVKLEIKNPKIDTKPPTTLYMPKSSTPNTSSITLDV